MKDLFIKSPVIRLLIGLALILTVLTISVASASAQIGGSPPRRTGVSIGDSYITEVQGENVWLLHQEVSAKEATSMIVKSINSRAETTLAVNGQQFKVTYQDKVYTFDGLEFTRVSDVRKYVRDFIRSRLMIE